MNKSHSVIIGASIVLGCLILGLTLNSPAAGQGQVGPPTSGKYQMMVAGSPGAFIVITCNSLTGQCWSKDATGRTQDEWHPLGSPEIKAVAQPAGK